MKLFYYQLRAELQKMFARQRTYIGFGAFLVIELVILIILQLPKVQRSMKWMVEKNGYAFDEYNSGLTLAVSVVSFTSFLMASLYLALVAGDLIAKEVEEGTLRMMLCRPISRLRIIAVKYTACVIYTFALVFFIGLSALVAGIFRQGMGGLFVALPLENVIGFFSFHDGLLRYLALMPVLAVGMLSVTSMAFMFSCFPMKPAAATITTLSYLFMDMILRQMPNFESIREWLITTHMATWANTFREPAPIVKMVEDYSYLVGVNATLVTIGAIAFLRRDFKS